MVVPVSWRPPQRCTCRTRNSTRSTTPNATIRSFCGSSFSTQFKLEKSGPPHGTAYEIVGAPIGLRQLVCSVPLFRHREFWEFVVLCSTIRILFFPLPLLFGSRNEDSGEWRVRRFGVVVVVFCDPMSV